MAVKSKVPGKGVPQIAEESAVRERLVTAATALFATKGYAATTVREIVAKAGVTKPVLYYHFGSKEGIYIELMGRPFATFCDSVRGTVESEGTFRERLFRLAEESLDLFVAHIEVARIMHSIYYGPPQGAPFIDFDAMHISFQDAVRELLRGGIRGGEFKAVDVEAAMWAIVGAVNVSMESELCHPENAPGRKGLRKVMELILDGIAPGNGRDGRVK